MAQRMIIKFLEIFFFPHQKMEKSMCNLHFIKRELEISLSYSAKPLQNCPRHSVCLSELLYLAISPDLPAYLDNSRAGSGEWVKGVQLHLGNRFRKAEGQVWCYIAELQR